MSVGHWLFALVALVTSVHLLAELHCHLVLKNVQCKLALIHFCSHCCKSYIAVVTIVGCDSTAEICAFLTYEC